MTKSGKGIGWEELKKKAGIDVEKLRPEIQKVAAVAHKAILEDLRLEKGFTQAQLAKKLGVDQSRISRIENGALDTFEVRTLQEYAEALGGKLEVAIIMGEDHIKIFHEYSQTSPKSKAASAKPRKRRAKAKKAVAKTRKPAKTR